MPISYPLVRGLALASLLSTLALCQDASTAAPSAKTPLDHVLGTITTVDKTSHTVTIQEDKTGTAHVVQLSNTKTLLKVEPTAKDLKGAVRITADDLETGDRVDVRGTKVESSPTSLDARSVILMSGRALEETHQQQSAAWARSTAGRVTAVDAAGGKITADVRRGPETRSVSVQTTNDTEFTRYSADTGKPAPSQISQIQVGDQLKVIGEKSEDGALITAQRVYSGAFRTISATIAKLGADGKSMTVRDLATKKDIDVALDANAAIHRLPLPMADGLARRLNPGAAATTAAPPGGGQGVNTPHDAPAGGRPGGANPGGGNPGRGDISQMLESLPKIALADLKSGDAIVISGVATGADNSHLVATTVIAGVEPILKSAPQQRGGGRSVGGDWGLGEMSAPQ